jgi:hypothetical protein
MEEESPSLRRAQHEGFWVKLGRATNWAMFLYVVGPIAAALILVVYFGVRSLS